MGTSGSTTTSHDWDQVYADVQNNTNTSGSIGTPVFVHDPVNSSSDNIFTGGSSKDIHGVSQWQWTNKKPQNKDDIADAFAAAYTDAGPGPTTGDTILYTGLDRYSSNGDSTVGFWFFQNPVSVNANGTFSGTHTPGDLLLVIDFGGGGTPTVNTYEWTGTDAAGTITPVTPPSGSTFAITNSATIPVTWPFLDKSSSASPLAGEFIEAGVDLNAVFGAERALASRVSWPRPAPPLQRLLISLISLSAASTRARPTWGSPRPTV